jgi:FMN phosphatase YigB (HAD superfamily)
VATERKIDIVFFDIGDTLGELDRANQFHPYPSSAKLLGDVRGKLGLRVGIITNLGKSLTNDAARALIRDGGLDLDPFLDPAGFVSDNDAGASKPDPAIYQFAAQKVGVPVERCLFVGENLTEVLGAITAGMHSVLKPCPPGRDLPT